MAWHPTGRVQPKVGNGYRPTQPWCAQDQWYSSRLFLRPAREKNIVISLDKRITFTALALGAYFDITLLPLAWQDRLEILGMREGDDHWQAILQFPQI